MPFICCCYVAILNSTNRHKLYSVSKKCVYLRSASRQTFRSRMRSLRKKTTMPADTPLLQSLVEEYVSGLQDSKAKDAATGKSC